MARVHRYGLAQPVPYFAALLNSPLIAEHIIELGVVYRWHGTQGDSYGHRDRVWADLVLGRQMENGTFYAFMCDAVAFGVRPAAIEALWRGRENELTDDERELTAYVREVVSQSVREESYRRLEERMGSRGAVEYTAFVGHLLMTLTLMKAFDSINFVVSDAEIEERLAGLLDGTIVPSPPAMPSLHLPAS